MPNKQFLVVIETQRVKGYLFASPTLRETRGASLLLDRLNRYDTRQKILWSTDGEEIYLGGGSGRILFATLKEAEDFAHKVRTLYRQETANARVSVVVEERQVDESFPAWIARGVRESQSNKLAHVEAVPLVAGRWIRPCSSCGVAPAETEPRPDVQGFHYLCRSCLYKREEVSAFYHGIKQNWDLGLPMPPLSKLKKDWPDFILTTLAEAVQDKFGKEVRVRLPQDVDQIAARSRPGNYIGFIYADGNRMGETVKSIGDRYTDDEDAKKAYKAFSEITDQATRKAAVQAVLDIVGAEPDRNEPSCFVPAEFVVAGGDDLMLVVPVHTALPVAARFISLFQERSKELQEQRVRNGELPCSFAPEGMTTSAGVVLAHASYPASQLLEVAADLMKSAKRKAADLANEACRPPHIEGTLDFLVLHEAGSERVKERRKSEYVRSYNGRPVYLTERPYTATETLTLLDRIRALKSPDVPRTKLKALYPLLFQSHPVQAQFDGLRLKERLKATGALKDGSILQKLVNELHFFPFRRKDPETWTTPLSEYIELYDFVPPNVTLPSSGVADA